MVHGGSVGLLGPGRALCGGLDRYQPLEEDDPDFGIPTARRNAGVTPQEMVRQMHVRQMHEQRADEAMRRKAFADEQERQRQANERAQHAAQREADADARRQATETATAAIPKHAAAFPGKALHELPPEKQALLNAQFPAVAWQLARVSPRRIRSRASCR